MYDIGGRKIINNQPQDDLDRVHLILCKEGSPTYSPALVLEIKSLITAARLEGYEQGYLDAAKKHTESLRKIEAKLDEKFGKVKNEP